MPQGFGEAPGCVGIKRSRIQILAARLSVRLTPLGGPRSRKSGLAPVRSNSLGLSEPNRARPIGLSTHSAKAAAIPVTRYSSVGVEQLDPYGGPDGWVTFKWS
jgi:hypothetical protein